MRQNIIFLLFGLCITNIVKSQCTYYSRISGGKGLSSHTLGLKTDGTAWSWGANGQGQCGNGTYNTSYQQIQIGTTADWADLSAGAVHSLGLKSDGSLWAWGYNANGQLGIGSYTGNNAPVQVGTSSWKDISAGNTHSLAIRTDGTLWAWGDNSFGELGNGTNTSFNTPVQVGTDINWKKVIASSFFSLAIKTDGTLWSWGYNNGGMLGDGTGTDRNYPLQVGTGNNWAMIASGGGHVIGLKTDGTLWSWGNNQDGQLGNGTFGGVQTTPVQVGTETDWSWVSSGGVSNLAVKKNGSLWSWGNNVYGQLGDGTTVSKNSPVQILSYLDDVAVSASGYYTSFYIGFDGAFRAWGDNGAGQCGISGGPFYMPNIANGTPFNPGLATNGTSVLQVQADINYYTSPDCRLMTRINKQGTAPNPVNGTTTTRVWVETIQPASFVKRHYEITPGTNPGTVSGKVTLFFTQQEFNEFNTINSVKLPVSAADASGKANLRIEKRDGISSDGTGLPSSYTGTVTTINPDDNDIVFNFQLNAWEVRIDVAGFSGFFAKTIGNALPLKLLSFSGKEQVNLVHLTWQTSDEANTSHFIIQRSSDGRLFMDLGSTIARNTNGNNSYDYIDNHPLSNINYYRLLMMDRDGKKTYSQVIRIDFSSRSTDMLVFPNPAKNSISLSNLTAGSMIRIFSADGRVAKQLSVTGNSMLADISSLASGLYIIQYCKDSQIQQQKLIKE
ncbi:MAG: T9SS type A sorting domain-containing protein [Chitinophagaceae bacterium]